ncbi:hypothetical protein [Pimelobacter simplex]|uniref:hypothetical protein n=1 Tax=Nocardioides simplex TaxID=2045 RepID=UPI00214F9CBC|nr:hypothetical protein [Pimelobacter simplex]UUW87383.1 hypothetical protein M0M43_16710 [Pimelobacter simplex]UUW96888.1 hypothetical protein M0M48_05355 [Pimelobacter simplex]
MTVLVDNDEALHRQVHCCKEDGTPMSLNFRPSPKDNGYLSTRQGSVVTAEEAYEDHKADGWKTLGTWTFLVNETELLVIDDQHEPGQPRGHASVDFHGFTTKAQAERESKRLALCARNTHAP